MRSLFRNLLLEGVWHAFSKIWVAIGAPIGAPFCHVWQLFQGLILEAVFGWQKEANDLRNAGGGPAAGAGPVALLLPDSGTGFYTPSAMPKAWGGGS